MSKTYTLITGASSGIGKALAEEFAAHGKNLILVARSEDKLANMKANLLLDSDIDIKVFPIDLLESSLIDKLYLYCKNNHLSRCNEY